MVYYQDAFRHSKHQVTMTNYCEVCAVPAACDISIAVDSVYLNSLNTGPDFACSMLAVPLQSLAPTSMLPATRPSTSTRAPGDDNIRFIQLAGGETYLEEVASHLRHLVANACATCDRLVASCLHPVTVDAVYLNTLSEGQQFSCSMLGASMSTVAASLTTTAATSAPAVPASASAIGSPAAAAAAAAAGAVGAANTSLTAPAAGAAGAGAAVAEIEAVSTSAAATASFAFSRSANISTTVVSAAVVMDAPAQGSSAWSLISWLGPLILVACCLGVAAAYAIRARQAKQRRTGTFGGSFESQPLVGAGKGTPRAQAARRAKRRASAERRPKEQERLAKAWGMVPSTAGSFLTRSGHTIPDFLPGESHGGGANRSFGAGSQGGGAFHGTLQSTAGSFLTISGTTIPDV